MPSGRNIMMGFVFLLLAVLAILYFQTTSAEKIIYEGNFEDDCNLEGDFLRCKGNELYLDTQNSSLTGSGVWNKEVSLSPGKISWNWEGEDLDNFSLWLKVTFSNHKSIYYVAAGSKNPQSIPQSSVERDLVEDYTRYCGPAENIKVVSVSAELGDNSTQHRNILKISDLKIYGQS